MPVTRGYTKRGGVRRGWYSWGTHGKRYEYPMGDVRAREAAKAAAARQGRAIKARGGCGAGGGCAGGGCGGREKN